MSYIINNRKKNKDKRGNLTVLLIGVITVMLLMTAAMSRRMSGHTRLLTLSDYTQISRYFLESYVSEVMQHIRSEANNPNSDFSKLICGDITAYKGKDITNKINYTPSDELGKILAQNYKPHKIDFLTSDLPLKIILGEDTEEISYNNVVTPGPGREKDEKKGSILISCECKFQKRKYKMEVTYPFSVVYRMTPILKDFMLFVDNIKADQDCKNKKDDLNVLVLDENGFQLQNENNRIKDKIKPFVLLQPLDNDTDPQTTGKVYLGGNTNSPVYLNLAGGKFNSVYRDTDFIFAKDLDLNSSENMNNYLSLLPFIQKPNGEFKRLFSHELPLLHYATAKLSVMGFSYEMKNVFNGCTWNVEDFLSDDSGNDYLENVKIKENDLVSALTYSSAIRLLGLNPVNPFRAREIYGDVFARFIVYTFWQPNGTAGLPLFFSKRRTIEDIPEQKMWNSRVTRKFEIDKTSTEYDSNADYTLFMSKVVSGLDISEKGQKYAKFLDMNCVGTEHENYKEENFNSADGFKLENNTKFYNYWKSWFVDKDSSDNCSPIEKRIGRVYDDQKEFKEAVGYNNEPTNFNINGVVYVKGDLDIDKDLILDENKCSGGIILVDGKININNIYRGEVLQASNFLLSNMTATKNIVRDEWTKEGQKSYIAPDKIITFVSLKGQQITINGNILLGVQLINLNDLNNNEEQIKWGENVKDNIVFYGSMVCNRLDLIKKLKKFGTTSTYDDSIYDIPFFIYPRKMATSTPPLAVQIREYMDDYKLTSTSEES